MSSNYYQDKELTCKDCGRDFRFSSGEQEFYNSKGLSEPKRCKSCRIAKKQKAEQNQDE